MVNMTMEQRLKAEIESLKKQYEVLKDYLSGVEYNLSDVRACLHAIKDGLSRVRVLYAAFILDKKGTFVDFPVGDLPSSLDLALVMIEWEPQKARAKIQTSLALSRTKIEDIMAVLDLFVG